MVKLTVFQTVDMGSSPIIRKHKHNIDGSEIWTHDLQPMMMPF